MFRAYSQRPNTVRCRRFRAALQGCIPFVASLLLSGCGVPQMLLGSNSSAASLGEPAVHRAAFGYAVAPVPEAATAAKKILNEGGNAVDAATAAGFALAVTLPSRAGLGGGGACLIDLPKNDGGTGSPLSIMFMPQAGSGSGARPAAVPMLARGLIAMQARYGRLSLAQDLAPAEVMAAAGVPVSRQLADDLDTVGNAFLEDPDARGSFASRGGQVLRVGEPLIQPDLATVLSRLQTNGLLGFYQGRLARHIVEATDQAGGGLTLADLKKAKAAYMQPVTIRELGYDLAFLPPPAAGGVGAAAAIETLAHDPRRAMVAANRALAVALAARDGEEPAELLAKRIAAVSSAPPMPASASFAVLDGKGGAVGCVTTMDNLFGTGRIARGTGIVLAASPARIKPPLLTAGLATRKGKFRAIAVGSGQGGAPFAVGDALFHTIQSPRPMTASRALSGQADVIACSGLMPGRPGSCGAVADPKGFGVAVGGN